MSEERREAQPIKVTLGPDSEHPVRITYAIHSYPKSEGAAYLSTGEPLIIGVAYHASIATEDVVFSLELRDAWTATAS